MHLLSVRNCFRSFLSCIFILSHCPAWSGENQPLPDAGELFQEVQATFGNAKSYSAELTILSEKGTVKAKERFFQVKNADGSASTRIEVPMDTDPKTTTNKLHFVTIVNSEGMWTLWRNSAIKMDYMADLARSKAEYLAGINFPTNNHAEYKVAEKTIGKHACFAVTEILSDVARAKGEQSYKAPAAQHLLEKYNTKVLGAAATRVYYVDKNDRQLCAYEVYDAKGNLTQSIHYSNIRLNEDLSPSLFNVPADWPKISARTKEEYQQLITGQRITSGAKPVARDKFFFLLALITPAFVVLLVVVIKKSRRSVHPLATN